MLCLIVDDHQLTSAGLAVTLRAAFPDFTVSVVTTVRDAIRCIESHCGADEPSLVLLDLHLPDQPGTVFLQYVRKLQIKNAPLCIVISGVGDRATVDLCKQLGARGYVSKTENCELLERAIATVRNGGQYFYTGDAEPMGDFLSHALALTERQRTVLNLIVAGRNNREIAETLGLTLGTVKNYMHDLMTVFGVKSRLEMATKARESGYMSQMEL